MTGIFISYRRENAAPWAGRIYERLAHEFDRDQLFMDVDNIAPGLDFVQVLEEQIAACDVLLVVIGKDWAEARNARGERRLYDPNDFVRVEVEAALRRNVRVVPILVDGAPMPSHEVLPDSLRPLLRRNAVELTHARFGTDVKRLTEALAPVVKVRGAHQTDPAIQPVDGVVFERAALEHWESIKGTTDPKRLVEFIAVYGKSRMGRLAHDALQRLATRAWHKVNKRSESAVASFIESYPGTEEIADANATKAALQAAREQASALAVKKPAQIAEGTRHQSRTRARWVNWFAGASFCIALLLGAAVALMLAVPALRPVLPSDPASPEGQPPPTSAKAGVDRAPLEPPLAEPSPPSSGAPSEGEEPPRARVRPAAPLPPAARAPAEGRSAPHWRPISSGGTIACEQTYKSFWSDHVRKAEFAPSYLASISRSALRAYDACQAGATTDAETLFKKAAEVTFAKQPPTRSDVTECGSRYTAAWYKVRDVVSKVSAEQLAGASRMALRAYDACEAGDKKDADALFLRLEKMIF